MSTRSSSYGLSQRVDDLRAEMRTGLDDVRTEMRSGLDDVRVEMRTNFGDVRAEIRGLRARLDTLLLATIGGLVGVLVGLLGVIATLAVKL